MRVCAYDGCLSAHICICMYVYVYVYLPRMCALRDCEGALVDAYTITIITSVYTIARALRCVCVCMGIGMGMGMCMEALWVAVRMHMRACA